MWIPLGFAHGFYVLSDSADVFYKCTGYYQQGDKVCIRWDNPR
ncbi:dTDP-4-dehydrorhamnose 3,5-epimerase family protein [Aeromonas sp. S9(2024)]